MAHKIMTQFFEVCLECEKDKKLRLLVCGCLLCESCFYSKKHQSGKWKMKKCSGCGIPRENISIPLINGDNLDRRNQIFSQKLYFTRQRVMKIDMFNIENSNRKKAEVTEKICSLEEEMSELHLENFEITSIEFVRDEEKMLADLNEERSELISTNDSICMGGFGQKKQLALSFSSPKSERIHCEEISKKTQQLPKNRALFQTFCGKVKENQPKNAKIDHLERKSTTNSNRKSFAVKSTNTWRI